MYMTIPKLIGMVFPSYLLDYNFDFIFQLNDVETCWMSLKQSLLTAMSLFVSKVKLRAHQRPKWFTASIQNHLNKVHSLRKKARSTPSPQNLSNLASSESLLQANIAEAKLNYESHLVSTFAANKNYKIFNYMHCLTTHNSLPATIRSDSSEASSDMEKANLFNQYFHSVFTRRNYSLPSLQDFPVNGVSISEITFSESDVYEVLAALDPNKAMGIDGIGPNVLKYCAISLCRPIHHLFSLCVRLHSIPAEWCLHCIIPIFKSGDKSLVHNYRPISLLCSISKVLERLIYNNIIDHVSSCISDSQFGFLQHHSTIHQLLLFLCTTFNSFDQRSKTDCIYLDLRKAFDTVPHNELLFKFWSIGITGSLWELFQSYLWSRSQCVSINNSLSDKLPVISGVPQGSILGPILFIIYINDLPSTVSSSIILMFADDTKCYRPISCPNDSLLLQRDLDSISEWRAAWNLSFNSTKCAALHFSRSPSSSSSTYYLNGDSISDMVCHRDLGVIMSRDLSWSNHYDYISAKAYKTLGLIRHSFHHISSISTKRTLYISLIRPQILYGSQIWRPHLIKDIIKIENIQRRASKFIPNDFLSDYKSRLTSLHILPLMLSMELNDIIFMVSCLQSSHCCIDIHSLISFSSSDTRSASSHKMIHSISSTNHSRHFFFNQIPRLWNALPSIDLDLSINTIKKQLTKFFWVYFTNNFDPSNPCSFHFVCPCSKCSLCSLPSQFTKSL